MLQAPVCVKMVIIAMGRVHVPLRESVSGRSMAIECEQFAGNCTSACGKRCAQCDFRRKGRVRDGASVSSLRTERRRSADPDRKGWHRIAEMILKVIV
jgi:hypothetical protein